MDSNNNVMTSDEAFVLLEAEKANDSFEEEWEEHFRLIQENHRLAKKNLLLNRIVVGICIFNLIMQLANLFL